MTHQLLKPARGYSNAVLATPGRMLFVAGQIGFDAEERLVSLEFAPQFEQALANVVELVREAGGQPEDVCRVTIYVVDKTKYIAAAKEMGQAWRKLLGRHYPAMTLVEVKSLLEPSALVEIEATAVIA